MRSSERPPTLCSGFVWLKPLSLLAALALGGPSLSLVSLGEHCSDMRGVRISYLVEHPDYIPQLAQWLFEQWDSILGEKTPEARIKKLNAHMSRDQLPIAWVAHANGQLLGTAALRVHDLEERKDLTPWLGGVFVGSQFRRRGIGAALCATVEEAARSRGIQTLYLFTLDKQAWYLRLGWKLLGPCIWYQRPGDIMSKELQSA
jgi:GNAT superfamily N-acetyltransferase